MFLNIKGFLSVRLQWFSSGVPNLSVIGMMKPQAYFVWPQGILKFLKFDACS